MKINAGVVTDKIEECLEFYTEHFSLEVAFQNDFYLLLAHPEQGEIISFLKPHHESQQPLFQPPFGGEGIYLTIEVDDVDAWYDRMQSEGVPIAIALRDEPWGDRHFAVTDPNGIGIDIVTYHRPEGE